MERSGVKMDLRKPGCLSQSQIDALRDALLRSQEDPSLMSDLEGCGPVAQLEEAFAKFVGTRYALALSSGTAAIHAGLLAAGVSYGDEVVVTPYSWPQSVAPVLFTGAVPVFADIDPETFHLDPESVAERMSPRTQAIICPHLFGHMADMVRIQKIAMDCHATLITDCAHALGARYHGISAGAWGDVACFSLGRGKLISSGEGGILATNNRQLFETAICFTQHEDRVKRIWPASQRPEIFSLTYRMHPLAAILGLSDLNSIGKVLALRQRIFKSFREGMGSQDLLSSQESLPQEEPVAYGIPLTVRKDVERKELVFNIQQQGVPLRCGPVCTPLHLRLDKLVYPKTAFHPSHLPGSCPSAEERCSGRELFVLSALDMDGISADRAFSMGQVIREELARAPAKRLGRRRQWSYIQASNRYLK